MSEGQRGEGAAEQADSAIVKYFKDFKVLKETRREYWGLQLINMLDSLAYFAMFNIAVVTLSKDFGFTDAGAGWVYMLFSSLTTIFLFFSGVITDWLGIKRALYIGMIGLLLSRAGVVAVEYLDEPTRMSVGTALAPLHHGKGIPLKPGQSDLQISARDGKVFQVDLGEAQTIGDVIKSINEAPENRGSIRARVGPGWRNLRLEDQSGGEGRIIVEATPANPDAAAALGLLHEGVPGPVLNGKRIISDLNGVALASLNQGEGLMGGSKLIIQDRQERLLELDSLDKLESLGALIERIKSEAQTKGMNIRVGYNTPGTGLSLTDGAAKGDLNAKTLLSQLNKGKGIAFDEEAGADLIFESRKTERHEIDLTGAVTLGDILQKVKVGSKGQISLELIEGRLAVTDHSGGRGLFKVLGAGKNGPAAARGLRIFKEKGVEASTFDGGALSFSPIKDPKPFIIKGDAAEALGFEFNKENQAEHESTIISGENIVEHKVRSWLVVALLALMAPFMAMMITVFQAGNRRFTTKKSRGAGFNLWYLFMNVGAAGGGFLIDLVYLDMDLPHFHVFTFGVGTAVLCLISIFLFIKNTGQLHSDEELVEMEEEKKAAEERGETLKEEERKNPWDIVKEVLSESVFWRFTILISLLLGVRAVFLYLGLLFPKFWYRVIGEDAQVGALQAFNPILVIIGLAAVIPLLERFNVYKMLVFGALITSISMFIPALPPMGGIDVATWTYYTTIGFLLVLTIGELIWSPRLSEFTAAIAPEGQEGTYLGLSMVPYFLAKMVVSALSGPMLQRWCPEYPAGEPTVGDRIATGEVPFMESPYLMWLILGVVALLGTIAAFVGKSWFTKGAHFDNQAEPSG